jgi:hypothetical protein
MTVLLENKAGTSSVMNFVKFRQRMLKWQDKECDKWPHIMIIFNHRPTLVSHPNWAYIPCQVFCHLYYNRSDCEFVCREHQGPLYGKQIWLVFFFFFLLLVVKFGDCCRMSGGTGDIDWELWHQCVSAHPCSCTQGNRTTDLRQRQFCQNSCSQLCGASVVPGRGQNLQDGWTGMDNFFNLLISLQQLLPTHFTFHGFH